MRSLSRSLIDSGDVRLNVDIDEIADVG